MNKILERKNNKRNEMTMKIISREIKFSAVILTKNEEDSIVDCIDSVLWCDEIIIVDDLSVDRTIEIVKNLKNEKIKVYKHQLDKDFSRQRNFGLEKVNGEWVLFVDADERISEGLRFEIEHVVAPQNLFNPKVQGFTVRRTDFIWGKELRHGETGSTRHLRLAKKHAGQWVGKVHEIWKIKGKVGKLNNPLFHYPHRSISEFLKEINFYTDLRAEELFNKRVKARSFSIITYPLVKFLFNFIFKRGFLDGMQGFILAILMSFHSFLVRGKLWSAGRKE